MHYSTTQTPTVPYSLTVTRVPHNTLNYRRKVAVSSEIIKAEKHHRPTKQIIKGKRKAERKRGKMAALAKWLVDPKRNPLAALHMKTISNRLRRYGIDYCLFTCTACFVCVNWGLMSL